MRSAVARKICVTGDADVPSKYDEALSLNGLRNLTCPEYVPWRERLRPGLKGPARGVENGLWFRFSFASWPSRSEAGAVATRGFSSLDKGAA